MDKNDELEKIRLVKVQYEDAFEIRDLLTKVYDHELKTVFQGKEEKLNIPGHGSVEMQRYRTWDDKYFKILYDDQLAGVVLIYTTGRDHARLDLLYILPEYQNMGVGGETIRRIEEMFPKVNVWQTDTTICSPRNHHFYESHGYVLYGEDEIDRYYIKKIGKADNSCEDYHTDLNCQGHNYRNSNYSRTDWFDVNMYQSRLEDMNLRECIFANVGLQNSRFTNTNMSNCVIADTRINDAELCYSNVSNLYMHDLNLDGNKETSFHMERCDMKESTIRKCNLKNLKIEQCDLEGVTIDGVSLDDLLQCYRKNH